LETLQKQLDHKMEEMTRREAEEKARREKSEAVAGKLWAEVSAQEAGVCREKLARDCLEIGRIVSARTGQVGGRALDAWEDGSLAKDLRRRAGELLARKTKLEARRRAVAKFLKGGGGEDLSQLLQRLEAYEEEESVRMHLAGLKREESALQEERRNLEARKLSHIRELKRVQYEDKSPFSRRPTLNNRYILLNLLGKGGFSEVWRAFDLQESEEVAVKVHQLNNQWSDAQKQSYVRHATREYQIHQQMRHPRIVSLTDVFEISHDSFATVLELCRGTDLERRLRERKTLPEKDARALVLQIARGLLYLNTAQGEGEEQRRAIIHYDLKPGNILFDENGDVKITDFGLSKIVDEDSGGGTSMELTSQGAGTYWYLPPECFVTGKTPPRISSKVDVWSLGVIFFQMLYGTRPFGEGQTQ
ncbi:unnamed protein product, partial [Discosporangium mesarthrocarpum]